MNINLDSARKFQNKVMLLSGFFMLLFPLFLLAYFSFGEAKFVYNKTYYAITVDKGSESAIPLKVIKTPLIDNENIKTWLSVGMTEIFSTDVNRYKSKARWESVKSYFSSSLAPDFWNKEIVRYEELLQSSYQLSNAVVSLPPVLTGQAKSADETRMWKYYLEVTTENVSINREKPLYKRLKMIVVVKEINPKSNYKGVAITSIEIK